MKINVKDKIPKSEFFEYFLSDAHGCSGGVNKHDSHKLFEGKKVVLTGVPGAFTPTCSEKHLPDFIEKENEVRALGINEIFISFCKSTRVSNVRSENVRVGYL